MKITVIGERCTIVDGQVFVGEAKRVYPVEFVFDDSWDGYTATAVFESAGSEPVSQLLVDGKCFVPWEVLIPNVRFRVGVFGVKDNVERPTIWTHYLPVAPGTSDAPEAQPDPTPGMYTQMLQLLNQHEQAEAIRVINEEARKDAEDVRQDSEAKRATAEAQRVANDTRREQVWESQVLAAGDSAKRAESAAKTAENAIKGVDEAATAAVKNAQIQLNQSVSQAQEQAASAQEAAEEAGRNAAKVSGLIDSAYNAAARAGEAENAAEASKQGAQAARDTAVDAADAAEASKQGAQAARDTAVDAAEHPPIPGENKCWMLWDGAKYVESNLPLPVGLDGEDGYTPVKGVDYFDGEDGYTPVKGVDYFDGKDGVGVEAITANGSKLVFTMTDDSKHEVDMPTGSGDGLPSADEPNKVLTTDSEGKTVWEDKPCRVEVKTFEMVPPTVLEFETDSRGNYRAYVNSNGQNLADGETYIVGWNGVEYEHVYSGNIYQRDDEGVYTVFNVYGGLGEFVIQVDKECYHPGTEFYLKRVEKTFYTLDVKYLPDIPWGKLTDKPFGDNDDGTVTKIDPKYLPDNIGAGATSWNDLEDKPFGEVEGAGRTEIFPETELGPIEGSGYPLADTIPLEAGAEYVVVWNGTEYTCTGLSYEGDEGVQLGVALGNLAAMNGDGDSGHPFAIVAVSSPELVAEFGFASAVAALDGSTTATLAIYAIGGGATVFPEATVNSTGEMVEGAIDLVEGVTYLVTWNGTVYECVCQVYQDDGKDIFCLGDVFTASQGTVGTASTGEPFVVMGFPGMGVFAVMDLTGAETATLKIAKPGGSMVVKTLDPKYLPEGVPYAGGSVDTILPETQLSLGPDSSISYCEVDGVLGLKAGEKYTVVYNGTEYEFVGTPIEGTSGVGLGNLDYLGGPDTGELIGVAEQPMYRAWVLEVYENGVTEATLAIYHNGEQIREIDPRCLPKGAIEAALPSVELVATFDDGTTKTYKLYGEAVGDDV